MTKDEAFKTIKEIILDVMDLDGVEVTLQSRIVEDLRADSLDRMSLMAAMEDEFKTKIGEQALMSVSTVEDIVNIALAKCK